MKKNINAISNLIKSMNTGKQNHPVVDLVNNNNKVVASVISKLISDVYNNVPKNDKGDRIIEGPNLMDAYRLSQNKMQDISDSESVMQLLPDLEFASQILVSCIISPKDMQTIELIHIPPDNIVPPNVTALLLACIKKFISDDYKIETRLPGILKDILFNTGSYAIAVIPENAIDDIINNPSNNVSIETLIDRGILDKSGKTFSQIGLLGSPKLKENNFGRPSLENINITNNKLTDEEKYINFSLESIKDEKILKQFKKDSNFIKYINKDNNFKFDDSNYFSVTDNYSILMLPFLENKLRSPVIAERIKSPALEAYDRLNDEELESLIYRKISYDTDQVKKIKVSDQCYRESVGEPLIMHFPSESVLNVFVPGSPSELIGHFIICDENGHPVTRGSEVDYYRDLGRMTSFNRNSMASSLLQKASDMFYGTEDDYDRERLNYAARAYGEIIETDLLNRLKNGIYGQSVKISHYTEVYRIMLSRALQQQQTRLVFIPTELMTYMAFQYDRNGIGYSLLDNIKVITSLSIHLLLADVRAGVMNSIPRTKVNVKLDQDAPDNTKIRSQIMNEYFIQNSAGNKGMPMGTSNPVEIDEWARRAGVSFSFSGDKNSPDMDIDISEYNVNEAKADTELANMLKALRLNGIGLSSETIDAATGADFAVSVVQQSLLLARRAQQKQAEFVPQLTDHIRKILLNSPKIINNLTEIILNNFDQVIKTLLPKTKEIDIDEDSRNKVAKKVAVAFINKYEISLPKPDTLSLNAKTEAFRSYVSALDEAIPHYISTEVLPPNFTGENLSENIDKIKSIIKSQFIRKWMNENDYLPELNDLLKTNDKGESDHTVYDIQLDFTEKILRGIGEMMIKANAMAKTTDAIAESNNLTSKENVLDNSSDTNRENNDDDFGAGEINDFENDNDGTFEDEPDNESTEDDTDSKIDEDDGVSDQDQ